MTLTDKAMAKSFHSVAKEVAADSLDDILHELRSIGFNAFPLLCGANAFICDGFSAKLIGSGPGVYIGKSALGRKLVPIL